MPDRTDIRLHLAHVLDWEQAHVTFEKAVRGIPAAKRGARAAGFEHSPWQLIEHMRLGQDDLVDFCVNPNYVHALTWPDDYWPTSASPPSAKAWSASIAGYLKGRKRLQQVVRKVNNLTAPVPTGKKSQTYLRAVLLVADHNAYHLGQLVAVRRALGIWR